MYLNQAKNHLSVIMKDTVPPFLWGPPGIGKSSIVAQVAREKGWGLIDLRLSMLNPVDLRGLPFLDKEKKEAVWLKPEFLPTSGNGILFLDELNTAPPSVQIAAYQLILDRKLGNYVFPDGWRVIAAGNRETDLANVTRMPMPLANRMIHLFLEADLEDWKMWAQPSGIDPRVVGFVNFRPKLLSVVPKTEEKAFPTPRSWDFVSRLLRIYKTPDEATEAIYGAVGEGAGKEFIGFLALYGELPDIDAILNGKSSAVPKKNDVLFALCSALVARLNDKNLDNFVKYSMHLPPEFSVLAMQDASRSSKSVADQLMQLKSFTDTWTKQFGQYLD